MNPRAPAAEQTRARFDEARARPLDRGFVITVVAATVVVLFLYMIRPILLPFVAAGIIAFVLDPVVKRLATFARGVRWVAALIVLLALLALFAATLSFVGPPFAAGAARTLGQLPSLVATTTTRLIGDRPIQLLGRTLTSQQIAAAALADLQRAVEPQQIASLIGLGAKGAFVVILGWVLLFYFLISGPRIAEGLVRLLPPPHRPLAWRMWARLAPVLRRYFLGILVVVAYATIVAYLGLGLALRLHHPLLLAVFSGAFEMVPVAGPILTAVVVGLIAVQQAASAGAILAFVIYALILRLSIDQVVGPLVLGRAARLHPTMVIFCFLSGALLFHIVGVILAVPVALTIKIALSTIYGEPAPAPGPG